MKTPSHTPDTPAARTVTIKKSSAVDLLRRLGRPEVVTPPTLPPAGAEAAPEVPERSIAARWNAAIGCKTSEVALTLLAQVIEFDQPTAGDSEERTDQLVKKSQALLAELEPENATQALLAAQMIGAQRLAMTFLERSMLDGQTVQGVDANILRATRLMRLFNEQVETMAKLKGKGGQQRVVVEHVTVAAGGQAVVGVVVPGGPRGNRE